MGKERIKNNQKDERMNNEKDRRINIHVAVIGLVGVIVGALIGFWGNWYTIQKQHQQEIEIMNREKKEQIYVEMIDSIYGLRKIYEGLVDKDVLDFREECYTIMGKARIFCDEETVDLYDEFLKEFFGSQTYNGEFVDKILIPAIREELQIED